MSGANPGAAIPANTGKRESGGAGVFLLPRLPWAAGALSPVISSQTVDCHYGLHHAGYAATANRLLSDREELRGKGSMEILRWSADREPDSPLFHHASQAYSHELYWDSLAPQKQRPDGRLRAAIEREFGDYARFAHAFAQAGMRHFGGGWLWLMSDSAGRLQIRTGSQAFSPTARTERCLLAIDLWEHAYYLDHLDRRREYLDAIIDRRLNWQGAQRAFAAAG